MFQFPQYIDFLILPAGQLLPQKRGNVVAVFHILVVVKGPNKRSSLYILLKAQVSWKVKANVWEWHRGWCMCVCLCRASQQCPSACTTEKQPCINRTPADTIFSGGDAFQHMCWWMTTGWRCDFEAPNVLSLTTCACQCVSSLTLGAPRTRLSPSLSCNMDRWETVIETDSS